LTGGAANARTAQASAVVDGAAMVFRDGELPNLSLAHRAVQGYNNCHGIILDIVDFGLNLAEATEAVRVHDQGLRMNCSRARS